MIVQLQHYAQSPSNRDINTYSYRKATYLISNVDTSLSPASGFQPIHLQIRRIRELVGRVAEIASLTRHRNLVEGLKGVECLHQCQSFDGSSGLS